MPNRHGSVFRSERGFARAIFLGEVSEGVF
jgi:hypothetical protein